VWAEGFCRKSEGKKILIVLIFPREKKKKNGGRFWLDAKVEGKIRRKKSFHAQLREKTFLLKKKKKKDFG